MKTDARVRYTRMRLREAFLTCLAGKPASKITVKELCDMAEINRATFYKHYADPFGLLDKLEREALASANGDPGFAGGRPRFSTGNSGPGCPRSSPIGRRTNEPPLICSLWAGAAAC